MLTRVILLILLQTIIITTIHANEGMWLPWYLPQSKIDKMHQMGMKIPGDDIFGSQDSSLNWAIVSLDEGSCTGSFISTNGLLLTNHHCAYSDIQKHSTLGNDLLKNGYWAGSAESELPNPGKTATILVDAKDVTSIFLEALQNASGRIETENIIDSISKAILDTVSVSNGQQVEIKDFLYQNMFFVLVTQTFRDVRLVGAPPEDIAQFGGENDNWMWPRHSADFALYRVYCSPEGLPADYSPENVPYQPKRVLKISTQGINEGDFTMTLGFPGETQRYITSAGLIEAYDIINPVIADVGKIKQSIWEKNMKNSPILGIQYADKYATSANFQKYAIGQNECIKKLNLIQLRREAEKSMLTRHISDKQQASREALKASNILYLMRKNLTKTTVITLESLIQGAEISSLVLESLRLFALMNEDFSASQPIEEEIDRLKAWSEDFFENYSLTVDREIFTKMLHYYQSHLEDSFRVDKKYLFKGASGPEDLAEKIYSQSHFADKTKFYALLQSPSPEKFLNDPAFNFYYTLLQEFGPIYSMFNKMEEQINYSMHLYVNLLITTDTLEQIYPDANSTLRLSFGKIKSYSPKDGIVYAPFSTMNGMFEKINSGESQYRTQTNLDSLFQSVGEKTNFPLCFITDNDITGGNSGSPVLNKQGEIVGLAFDGNWEGMGSDISYSADLQRCINVDIRYILFLINKLSNNPQLLSEINIVKSHQTLYQSSSS